MTITKSLNRGEIIEITEVKNAAGTYEETARREDPGAWEDLATDLTAKKLEHAGYITRITREQLYTARRITVTYDNNARSIYYISAE